MKKLAFLTVALFFTLNALAQTGVTIDPSLTESPVTLKTFSGSISGSLVVPQNVSGKIPVVLIIGDAGAVDRDGNDPKAGLTANTYKLLANDLGKKGIATLRYDKRLVGQSVTTTKESELRIDDYGDDAISLINLLNDDQRFSKIILFGHGEGSIVSMIAIADMPIKAFISAEGAGDPADKLLMDRMKTKPKFLGDEFKTILDSMRKGKTTDNIDPLLYTVVKPSTEHFIMSWCRCIPQKGIKKIKVPVLIVQGSTDLLISGDQADKLKKAKSDAILLVINNMNHILKDAPADPDQNMATYSKPDMPLKPEFVSGLVDFINKVK
jgi:alpha-beta hydrolase superfamily lysophospholipase